MANERYSENLVLVEMGVGLGKNDFGYVFPQGETGNFEDIEKRLREMGGKPTNCKLDDFSTTGTGKAKPEYIVTFDDDKNTILLVECKKYVKDHESLNRDMPQKYAVDGALFYAKHLKEDYNVLAVAVSGTSKENVKVNTFYWKKGFETPQELKKAKDTILEPLNYLNLANGKKMERKFSLQEIRELSQIMHEKLRQIKISEKDKPIFVAGILIALQNTDFRNNWNNINSFNSLVKLMIDSIEETLDNSDIKREKIEAIKSSFRRIKSNEKIKSILLGESGSLAWFIEQLEMRILPMMNHYEYTEDALSIFYHEFIKYSATDGKGLGIVLTPKHLTDFMCKLGEINKQSKVVDICCGSGSFLVTAMGLMCKDANETQILDIKKNGLYGVELDTDLYTLAITNMIIRKDGKSNIVCGDCFSQEIYNNLRNKHLSLGLINPPYSQEDKCELEFVEQLLSILETRGLAVAVVPMSCAIGTKFKEVRERLFKYHTLKAVFSMPDDIFYPTGVNVCVMVWEAHKTHDSSKPTFFGYCKDDGFVKRKKMGRIDYYNKWDDIEKQWLYLYENKKVVDGKSALQCVTANDEWLCEAYMKTDYSTLTQKDFQQTINDYLAYLVKNGDVYEN
ncbi:MAG: N-6 DNA methylase [Clostridiales bacterium]|nr:N-6 DNA methylase [Clostridiales bacterium]